MLFTYMASIIDCANRSSAVGSEVGFDKGLCSKLAVAGWQFAGLIAANKSLPGEIMRLNQVI